jgi:hypothetical protein
MKPLQSGGRGSLIAPLFAVAFAQGKRADSRIRRGAG